ncbi:large ribosomal subunit protein mL51-like [Ruditapes philippinarum]|uniref:large ribosomal subunit protein mL51-like n=1 Tax=Ruditapes philippinarum TaxID=129788 RepID=UPI00295BBC71|nr:large ribosomal subunit protein mL51-like [Ruditapes philippinarum]XP_060596800.1 large ribosomal subunit protein mL51-like [Ruditapes philippinarum]
MTWLLRGVSYCRQIAGRITISSLSNKQVDSTGLLNTNYASVLSVRCKTEFPPNKFPVASPYKTPGPSRHGYNQTLFDGGYLPRGLKEKFENLPKYKHKNVWNRKRATFGQNDYIDILGDSNLRPVDLIKAPAWLRGFNGNEMQRVVRRLNAEGHVIRQLYPSHYHNHWKRVKFLYKKYNKKRGKKI